MSQENVEIIRRGYAHVAATKNLPAEIMAPDIVWDMSKFRGWPEQATYEGIDGVRAFLRDWLEAWEDWELDLDSLHDASGDKVVAIVHQRGKSKSTGLLVDMVFGQVWTLRDGKETRMEMYADPAEALEAVGLSEQDAHAEP
jgi:ketosteroid isomerase-like protein